ncbi:Cuticle protein, partial [Armadillidium nasatum]
VVVLAFFLVSASASPQRYDYRNQGVNPNRGGFSTIGSGPFIPILRDDRTGPLDGVYSFNFETANGIRRHEQGSPSGPLGSVVSQGGWTFTFPDGTPAQFAFVADENGYRVESPLLPTPPPPPPHAIEQIRKAERERASGVIHDGQYRPQGGQGSFRPQGQGSFRPQVLPQVRPRPGQQRYYN